MPCHAGEEQGCAWKLDLLTPASPSLSIRGGVWPTQSPQEVRTAQVLKRLGSGWNVKQVKGLTREGRELGVALSQGLHVWCPSSIDKGF